MATIQTLNNGETGLVIRNKINQNFTNLNTELTALPPLIDEDDMASDSATAVPSQQSVKAYVDAAESPKTYPFNFEKNLTQNYADFITVLAGTTFTALANAVAIDGFKTSTDGGTTLVDRANIAAVNTASAGFTGGTYFQLYVGVTSAGFTGQRGSVILTEQ